MCVSQVWFRLKVILRPMGLQAPPIMHISQVWFRVEVFSADLVSKVSQRLSVRSVAGSLFVAYIKVSVVDRVA